jgi:LmbE family N-acetylglucosaminyl deacetylase
MHILAVGAHAADMEFTAGAAILAYTRAGHTATLLHLTPGEKGHPRMDPAQYAVQKRAEAEEAARRLNARVRFLDYKDAELLVEEPVARAIAAVIREERPDILITHPPHSIHSDHANCHHNVMRAWFLAELPGLDFPHPPHVVPRVYFAENWEDMEGYVPDTYVDVTDVFDDWIDAAAAYELFRGGISSFRYQDYYRALAVMRGCLGGAAKAVSFMRPPGFGRQRGKFPL